MSRETTRASRWTEVLAMLRRARFAGRVGLDLLMPPRCVLCEAELLPGSKQRLCESCVVELRGGDASACQRCAMTLPGDSLNCPHCRNRRYRFDRVIRVSEYAGPLREAVLRAKNLRGEPIAAALGDLLANSVEAEIAGGFQEQARSRPFDLVTCVPSFWFRRLRRGTNSAAVIAQIVAERLDLPSALDLLVCRRNVEKQSQLSLAERRKNVRRAFRQSWGYNINDADILLVDDVMTSGATAHEIAGILRRAGAQRVSVAVVARALGPDW